MSFWEHVKRLGATIALLLVLTLVAIIALFALRLGSVFRGDRVAPTAPSPEFQGPHEAPWVRGPGRLPPQ